MSKASGVEVSSLVLLSHETALRRRLDVVANNVANMNTTGFKREAPVFGEMVREMNGVDDVPSQGRRVGFVLDRGTVHDTSQGAFQPTGNSLDVMIDGKGYFQIRREDGSVAFTRAGHFGVSAEGRLVTVSGLSVLSAEGQPIEIGPDAGRVAITANGTVVGPQGEIGRIGVVSPADEAMLSQVGGDLFEGPPAPAMAADAVRLKVGGLEGSNVNAIAESATMVDVLRSYQSSVRISNGIDDLERKSIERLGRLP